MGLAVGVQHPVEAALRTDIQAPVRQHRHDLPGRKRREFRLVAGEQDSLAFLLTEAVSDLAVAALAAIDAITVTRELTAPALQRGEPYPKQQGQLTGPGTIGDALVEDAQGLPAVARRRQSSPSSPQKA